MSSYGLLNYQLVTHNPRHFRVVNPITENERVNIEKCLNELTSHFDPKKTIITGGLVVPLTEKRFRRFHGDIDLSIHERDLEGVTAQAMQKVNDIRYGLFSRVFMNHTSKDEKLDIYQAISPKQASRKKNVRFVRLDSRGKIVRHELLLDYIDVYLFRNKEERLFCLEDEFSFPEEQNIGSEYVTLDGKKLLVRGLEFIKGIKERRKKNEVDTHDLAIIDSLLKTRNQ